MRGRPRMGMDRRLVIAIVGGFVAAVVFMIQVGAVSELTVKWTINTSDVFPGRTFGSGYMSCQTVWDTDGDGVNEVVFGTSKWSKDMRFWCFDAEGRFEWIYPPIEEEGLPDHPYSKASLVDVDNDGAEELCFGDFSGRLHVLRGDGTILWTWDTPEPEGSINGAPQALDVDGDGFVEFFVHEKHAQVHRISHNGLLVWTSTQADKGGMYAQPTICDLDKDGSYEVLWNPYHCNIYCTDAVTGLNKWVYEGSTNPPVIVADVNRDDEYEIIAWNE